MLFVDRGAFGEEIWCKGELIIDAVGGIAVAAMIQGSEMEHVVALVGEDFEEFGPFFKRSHPLASDRLDC